MPYCNHIASLSCKDDQFKADELRFHGLEPNAECQGRSVAVAGECLSKPRSGELGDDVKPS